MPINLPNDLPAIDYLKQENIFVLPQDKSLKQDIRPLKIGVLNLMPFKIETETDLIRLLSNTPLQIELTFIKMGSHRSKNTPQSHIDQFYKPFESIREVKFDGFIITGAPVELLNFEEVDYWKELVDILDWTKSNVTSTIHICWAAQAGLYYHYKVGKKELPKKLSGVFRHYACVDNHPLLRGFDSSFYIPHSRHTSICRLDVESNEELEVLAESTEAGLSIISARNGRELYFTGHSEYRQRTLHNEYMRDKALLNGVEIPQNYYKSNDPSLEPVVRWRAHANLLFSNWLNYFVYQETPYNINDIR